MKPIALFLLALMPASAEAAILGDAGTAGQANQAAPVCCGALNAMTYSPLKLGVTNLPLNEKSSTFDFDTGKSYFGAFVLPAGNSLLVRVRSTIFQKPPKDNAIFFPRVMLLDQSKKSIAIVNWADDKMLHPAKDGSDAYIETVADLSAYPSARFMIVYTDGAQIGAAQELRSTIPGSSGVTPVTGVTPKMFFVDVPDPTLGEASTISVIHAPVAPGSLAIDIREPSRP